MTMIKILFLESDDGSGGTTAYLTIDGSATITKLQNTKLVDSAQLQVGDSADAKFYHDGNTYLDNNSDKAIANTTIWK